MQQKYLLFVYFKNSQEWKIYTSRRDSKDKTGLWTNQDRSIPNVPGKPYTGWVWEVDLPMEIFGKKKVPAFVLKNAKDFYHLIAVNQRDLNVNINLLPK